MKLIENSKEKYNCLPVQKHQPQNVVDWNINVDSYIYSLLILILFESIHHLAVTSEFVSVFPFKALAQSDRKSTDLIQVLSCKILLFHFVTYLVNKYRGYVYSLYKSRLELQTTILYLFLFVGAIFPPNTVTEVAFASALARASMESERYHFVMKAVYSPFGDSFTASKAGETTFFCFTRTCIINTFIVPLNIFL